jgi:hypothetical protein
VIRRVALLALLALIASCGSDSSSSDDARTSQTSASGVDVSVAIAPDPLVLGPVTFTVTVTNDTGTPLDLTFTSGQRAEVSLVGADGETAYTWSAARMFSQEISELSIPAGEREDFVLEEEALEVEPGEYTLRATVVTADRDLTASRAVTVRSS